MKGTLIPATNTQAWRSALEIFPRVDVCQTPEYHLAYSLRIHGSMPVMWFYNDGGGSLAYPFLLTPVNIGGKDTGYTDISSIYGYSGPLSTTPDRKFLAGAWQAFDTWAREKKIIAEFIRFSLYADNRGFAHPDTQIEFNRPSAVSRLPETDEELLTALGKKTRNMIRKAEKAGLEARELEPQKNLAAFRTLYSETMDRNEAPGFFLYDDEYYRRLLSLPPGELRLFGTFEGERLVAAAMALVYKKGALYHLGASLQDYNNLGTGNLCLFEMSRQLLFTGIEFLTVGGGRTMAENDPLFRFKKSNAMGVGEYYIGKRIIDPAGYAAVAKYWQDLYKTEPDAHKLQFYR
jgi:hypothetical protein